MDPATRTSFVLPRLYTPSEVAAHLQVSVRTIKRFIASGKLRAAQFGRAPRIAEQDLQTFLREGTCQKTMIKIAPGDFSSNAAASEDSSTFVGTTPPLDRQLVLQLAQQTVRVRAKRSTLTRSEHPSRELTPTLSSPR